MDCTLPCNQVILIVRKENQFKTINVLIKRHKKISQLIISKHVHVSQTNSIPLHRPKDDIMKTILRKYMEYFKNGKAVVTLDKGTIVQFRGQRTHLMTF